MTQRKGHGYLARHEVSEHLIRNLEEHERTRERLVARVRQITDDPTEPSLLPAIQDARDLRVLGDDVCFFLIVHSLEALTEREARKIYVADFAERFAELHEAYDVDPDVGWEPGTEPPDVVELWSTSTQSLKSRVFMRRTEPGSTPSARLADWPFSDRAPIPRSSMGERARKRPAHT
jgi:hypothetical protein